MNTQLQFESNVNKGNKTTIRREIIIPFYSFTLSGIRWVDSLDLMKSCHETIQRPTLMTIYKVYNKCQRVSCNNATHNVNNNQAIMFPCTRKYNNQP